MIIDDLDVLGSALFPNKADPVLVIYPYAVLPEAVRLQCFETIARRNPKVVQCDSSVYLVKLSKRNSPEIFWQRTPRFRCIAAVEYICSRLVRKGSDHRLHDSTESMLFPGILV